MKITYEVDRLEIVNNAKAKFKTRNSYE